MNRVAEDSVGVDIFDGAEIEFGFNRLILGNVGEPEFVRLGCDEVALSIILVNS